MAIVKVWNDNAYPHKERFKNEMVSIPPGGFVEMEYEDAIDFKGQFTGIAPIAANGKPDPAYFKMIRVERPASFETKDMSLVCHADGTEASTVAELKAKLARYEDRLLKDEGGQKTDDIADLKRIVLEQQKQIAALMEQSPSDKRGPGRPRKEA